MKVPPLSKYSEEVSIIRAHAIGQLIEAIVFLNFKIPYVYQNDDTYYIEGKRFVLIYYR